MASFRDAETGEEIAGRVLREKLKRGAWDGHELADEPGEVWLITDETGTSRRLEWVSPPSDSDSGAEQDTSVV